MPSASYTLDAVIKRRYLTSQNIWRALVAKLRSDVTLRTTIVGGYHEGRAPEKVAYPHLVWTPVVPGVNEDDWSSRTIVALADVVLVSRSSVEASNLDQSVNDLLDEGELSVTGQEALICYRVSDIRLDEPDEEGRKVYRIGGSYQIWTNQTQ